MTAQTLKEHAADHGSGEKSPESTDALLLEESDGTPAYSTIGSLITLINNNLDLSGHELTLADIEDAGSLAGKNTVATADIDAQAVTLDKIIDQAGFTAGSFSNPTVTVSQEGIITAIASGAGGGSLVTSLDSGTALAIDDDFDGLHKILTSGSAITLTLDAQASAGTRCAFTPGGAGAVTVAVESGAGFWLPGDDISGTARTTSFGLKGYGYFEVIRNTGGSAAEWAFVGQSDHAKTLDAALDANGKVISGNLAKVETDSGTLTDSQSGQIIVTSGNITIPTTAGFNVTLIAGGAHTVSFNSTTSAAMASGDIMSIVVQSSTVIHAVLTASADKVAFS